MNYITKAYQGRDVRIDSKSRYICLTDMAKANDKIVGNWLKLKGTKEFLEALALDTSTPIFSKGTDFIDTTQAETPEPAPLSNVPIGEMGDFNGFGALVEIIQSFDREQGTWAHPDVAMAFAQWCNPMFAIQVSRWMIELMTTGKVEIETEAKPAPARIEDPTTLGANFYAWDDRNKPKVKWWLDKLNKQNKGRCFRLLREVSGLSLLDVFSAETGDRVYTLFAFLENVSAVVEMREFMEARLNAGAKLVVRK